MPVQSPELLTIPSDPAAVRYRGRRFHIIMLDSDAAVRSKLRRTLSGRFTVTLLSHPDDLALHVSKSPIPVLVLLDWFAGQDSTGKTALGLLQTILSARPSLPVVVLFNSVDPRQIVLATRMGASDVLVKPFSESQIEEVICRHVTDPDNAIAEVDETPLDGDTSFVRCSQRIREIESQCILVARTNIPVLILGESGTGKEIAALFIHKMSARGKHGFLKVNCAAMPLDLLESELFGYEQGAFTGAVKSKPGKFELCDHGTIFLDEIGEMPAALQAKLLQVLQDGSFSRLGGRSGIKVDVRVIAATNIDIKTAIAKKHFREDLYYRLNGFGFSIPPLRERRDEIPILANYFMRRNCLKFGRDSLPISVAMMQALIHHQWPGNVRELENTIKRYLVLEDERAIINELTSLREADALLVATDDHGSRSGLKRIVRGVKGKAESVVIAQTLEIHHWNRRAAANELQISYKALLYKIKQYNLVQQKIA
jgi:two-component system, NtrC family, response regulator AtoC